MEETQRDKRFLWDLGDRISVCDTSMCGYKSDKNVRTAYEWSILTRSLLIDPCERMWADFDWLGKFHPHTCTFYLK